MSACICPHCGYDLRLDEPIVDGPVTFDPRGVLTINGVEAVLRPGVRILISTLLKADGRYVSREALIERLGLDCENPDHALHNVAQNARIVLRRHGLTDVIQCQYAGGYCWKTPPHAVPPSLTVTAPTFAPAHDGTHVLGDQ